MRLSTSQPPTQHHHTHTPTCIAAPHAICHSQTVCRSTQKLGLNQARFECLPIFPPCLSQPGRKSSKHCNCVPPYMNSQRLRSWEAWGLYFRMRAGKRKRGPDVSRMCPRLARGFAVLKNKECATVFGQQFRGRFLRFHSSYRGSALRAGAAFGLPPAAGVANLPLFFTLKRISLNPWHSGAPGGMHDTSDGRQGLMSTIRACTPLHRCNESIPLRRADAHPHVRARTCHHSQEHTDRHTGTPSPTHTPRHTHTQTETRTHWH